MPNMEKVINDLLDLRKDYEDMRCKVSIQAIDDTIVLLKEQAELIERYEYMTKITLKPIKGR